MSKSSLFSSLFCCFLVTLLLCFCTSNVVAQEPEMRAPPVPDVLPPPPPDPDLLPLPPEMVWGPLVPPDSIQPAGVPQIAEVARPQEDYSIAPPPPPNVETPGSGGIDPALAKPQLEVWREQSEWPQVPERQFNRLNPVLYTGTDPILMLVQFDPLLVGKSVYVMAGKGVALEPPVAVLTVSPSGECAVWARLLEDFDRGHITFYCEGVKTALPIWRALLQDVIANEAQTGGG